MSPTGGKDITWQAKNLDPDLVSQKEEVLTIRKDGYYFINLQVTLTSHNVGTKLTVSLRWNNKVILQGWINKNTSSTGLLGKVESLFAGGTLWVSIDPQTNDVDVTESVTHLDIIYMHNKL